MAPERDGMKVVGVIPTPQRGNPLQPIPRCFQWLLMPEHVGASLATPFFGMADPNEGVASDGIRLAGRWTQGQRQRRCVLQPWVARVREGYPGKTITTIHNQPQRGCGPV